VKPVHVYYFVGNDCLEEKVLAMVQSKKSETDDVKQTQLNAQQLKALIN
jgi:SNF2 family DNA or RNA helicase